jgi:two-component system, OmpR family, phosphate regulon sensor histidine kinase PhoR
MRRSIFGKIFTGYLLLIIVLSGLILAFSFTTLKSSYIDSLAHHLADLGALLREQVAPLLDEKRFQDLDALVKKMGKEIHTRITIVTPDGSVRADSEEEPGLMENHRTRTEVAQALAGGFGQSVRLSGTLKQEMLYIALPVQWKGTTAGVLRLSLFLKDVNAAISHTRIRILRISLLVIGLSLLIAFILSRGLSHPIRELSAASRRIAGGDFSARVFLKGDDELRELADNFNGMAARMKALFAELSVREEQLDNFISSLQEGFLVLDREERVLLSNRSFERIVGNDRMEGKFYWEVFRQAGFDQLIGKVRGLKGNLIEEIQWDGRILLCSATFLSGKEEIALLLHDITDLKNLERVKTDFVSNVSHELRTPLTAIKGFVETLESEAIPPESRRYLEIIKRNTDRLVNIINDLLLLSELEEKSARLESGDVDMKDLLESTSRIFEERVKGKGLTLTLDTTEDIPKVKGDSFKLEQMVINLMDNAIKYTEKGSITLSLRRREDGVELSVQDTGIGIGEDHLSRIFERFYVADKSRSKKLGGTGLGLSIVKHIVLLHNGTIHVESSPGRGTRFVVFLPSNPA